MTTEAAEGPEQPALMAERRGQYPQGEAGEAASVTAVKEYAHEEPADVTGSFVLHEPPWYGTVCPVVWEDGGSNPASYPIAPATVLRQEGTATRTPAAAGRQPDSPTARQPDSPTARQPDSPTARQPDSPTARQPDSPTARQPDSPTARQPDSPTARQPDSPTARQPDSPTARQPDSPTARQPDSPTARQPDSPTARQPDSPTARQPDSRQPTARQPDSPTARQPDSPTARQPDSPTARQPDSPTARQPDSPTARQPDSPTARQPDSPTARQPDSPTARQPDSPTARQPDSPTARQPDSPTARQPDSPTARQPDSPTARQPDSPTARQPDSPTARQPDSPTARHYTMLLSSSGAARRGARPSTPSSSSRTVPARAPARRAVGAFRRGVLATLALVLFLCGPVPTAQALDGSDWTLTATRGGVKIILNIQGEGSITHYEVFRKTGSDWPKVINKGGGNRNVIRDVFFDTGAPLRLIGYRLDVRRSPLGWLDTSKTVTPITLAVPDQPTNFAAAAGAGQVTLSWSDPSDPSIQRYEYRQKSGGGNYPSSWTAIPNSGDTTNSYTVPSLTAGTAYAFQIRAVNTQGGSTASADRTATPAAPTTVPAKPANFAAAAGNGQVVLSWDNPNDASIIRWQVRRKTTGDYGSWSNISGSGPTTISHTVTGLTNGTLYTFQVRAVNGTGDGAASNGASATPAAVPSKPGAPTLAVGNAQLGVSWSAPANNGALISDYDVRYRAGNSGPWTDANHNGAGTSTTIASLANGTSYQVQVRARNSVGWGGWSNSASATPAAAPDAPGTPGLTVGNAQLGVSWSEPANNGASISDYDVRYRAGNSGGWTDANYNGTGTSTTISSLANGTSYQVQVRARNSVDWGGWSNSASATPAAAPDAPGTPGLTVGNAQLGVSWSEPANNGASISDYDVRYRAGNSGGWTDANYNGTGTSTTISSLANGTSYQVQVRARNSVGWGGWSDSASDTPATTPAVPTLTPDNGQLKVDWTAPSVTSGAAITEYEVRVLRASNGALISSSRTGSSTTTVTFDLTNGVSYRVQVRAKNSAGYSPWSGPATDTPAAAPDAPGTPTLTPGNGQITVEWAAPAANGAAINDYDVQYKQSGVTAWTAHPHSGAGRRTVIAGLSNGQSYDVQVLAKNGVGSSGWSPSATDTPAAAPAVPAMVPAKPANFAAAAGNG